MNALPNRKPVDFEDAPAAPTTNEGIRELISVCTGLIDVFARETDLLQAMRPGEISELQNEKATLALNYEDQVRLLVAEPDCFRAVEPVLRKELKAVMAQLERARAANERALMAAREANERVIRCIVEAVAGQQSQAAAYGPDGGQSVASANHADDTISLSVNQQI